MGEPIVLDGKRAAKQNTDFRRVLYTGTRSQLVAMSLPPGGEIGAEVHASVDQLFYVVKGSGVAVFGDKRVDFEKGMAICVPAGTRHNLLNSGDEALKLLTIYSPPQHAADTVHATKADADAAEHAAGKIG